MSPLRRARVTAARDMRGAAAELRGPDSAAGLMVSRAIASGARRCHAKAWTGGRPAPSLKSQCPIAPNGLLAEGTSR